MCISLRKTEIHIQKKKQFKCVYVRFNLCMYECSGIYWIAQCMIECVEFVLCDFYFAYINGKFLDPRVLIHSPSFSLSWSSSFYIDCATEPTTWISNVSLFLILSNTLCVCTIFSLHPFSTASSCVHISSFHRYIHLAFFFCFFLQAFLSIF